MIGMLWRCPGPQSLEDKIREAAEYYQQKYGWKPDLVLVSPKEINHPVVEGLTIRPDKSIRPNYLLIGRQS